MKSLLSRSVWLIAAAVLTLLVAPPTGSLAAELSADLVMTPKDKSEQPITARFYVKGDKLRQEITEEGEQHIVIVRPDKKISWMITPSEKMYMEIPYEEGESFEEWTPEMEKNAKLLGTEKIGGMECKKFQRDEEGEKVTYWITSKHPFPMKIEDSESVVELKNVKEGGVNDSFFELPADYQKMAMPTMSGHSHGSGKEKE